MKAGDLQGMADTISDDMLEHFALVSTWDEMADRLKDRYEGTASRVVMYLTEEHMRKKILNLWTNGAKWLARQGVES